MKFYLLTFFLFFSLLAADAQDASLALQKPSKFDQKQIESQWSAVSGGLQVSFTSSNLHFAKELVPQINTIHKWKVKAWKGEKVSAQILSWTRDYNGPIKLQVSSLKSEKGNILKRESITLGFIDYVMTDEFKNGCGHRKSKDFDSSYVADVINTRLVGRTVSAKQTQPIWFSINVPAATEAGIYTGEIKVVGEKEITLPIQVEVLNRTLPPSNKWKYDLDLWQHPAAIARVHQVDLWSNEHYRLMETYYRMLANAGQKTITTSIVNEPWGHQTYDDYPSLVKWIKKKDGTWEYDYTLFDKYVQFVMDCGIDQRINCYSMVPWKIAFTYFDEESGKELVFKDAIGTPTYNMFWKSMLTDFTKHLKGNGWFGKTYIAMDERPMKAMQDVIALLKSVDKDWKIALAGDYHPEIEKDIDNYCIASRLQFPDDVLKRRQSEGRISTWYTCCTEPYPNLFTFSSPAEGIWMGWYTANKNMDGYLRWAYNSWTKSPLLDSRFTAWPAGDTYLVYPGPFSSVRFEKLVEGIQDFEKIQQFKAYYQKNGQLNQLQELNNALAQFEIKSLSTVTADQLLGRVRHLLNN